MPKFKALIMFMIVAALSFSLIGCGQLATRNTDPEVLTGQGGELPEWLLLAHRSTDGPGGENDNGILNPKESDEDEDDSIADESADQDTTQTASAPSSSGSTSGRTSAPKEEESKSNDSEPKPGEMGYLEWMNQNRRASSGTAEQDDDDDDPWFQTGDGGSSSWFNN